MSEHDEKKQASEGSEGSAEGAAGAPAENRAEAAEARGGAVESPDPLSRAPAWGGILVMVLIAAGMLAAGVIFAGPLREGYERARSAWVSEDGGKEGGDAAAEAAGGEAPSYYTCGMHPWVVLPEPGTCPVCQMDLTPLDPEKFTGEIAIDPVIVQNMGVRVQEVTSGPMRRTVRTVGTVDYDETRVRDVNLKVSGWIEKLRVDYLGATVEKGEPLFELYSPQLYEAQQEYLLAWRNRGNAGGSSSANEADGETAGATAGGPSEQVTGMAGSGVAGSGVAGSMLSSAKTRLQYLDITDEQIDRLRERGRPSKTMTIRSPHGGTVIEKHANEGMKVDSGMRVYRIADLSEVWVMATVYEHQLPFVREGQRATMRLAYLPGRVFEGRVDDVYPFLKEGTREVRVRLAFKNPDGVLKPGMYANVELKRELAGEAVLAPGSAVIDTGQRQVAFVSLGEGKFEPRDVKLGATADDGRVRILEGLEPGEKVVTTGQFLLDSEARMREALAKMVRGEQASEQKPGVPTDERSTELDSLPGPAAEALTAMLEGYFQIGDALASDSAGGIGEAAGRIASSVESLREVELESRPHFWHERMTLTETLVEKARALEGTAGLEDARPVFAELSGALAELVGATGVPAGYEQTVQRLRCPMYPQDAEDGSVWLQPAGDARNPFFGAQMLRCFDERVELPVTEGGDSSETSGGDASSSSPPADEGSMDRERDEGDGEENGAGERDAANGAEGDGA